MRRPVVVWTALFAVGVVLYGLWGGPLEAWWVLVGAAGGAIPVSARWGFRRALLVPLLIIAVGGWWHGRERAALDDGLDPYVGSEPVLMTGVVVDVPEREPERTFYVLRLRDVAAPAAGGEADGSGAGGARDVAGARVRVTVLGPSRYDYGDVLQVRAVLERPRPPGNPGAFDYEAYLARRGVTATAFVRYPRHVVAVDRETLNPLLYGASRLRAALASGLRGALSEDAARLLGGVVLGDRRGLTASMEETFRRSGLGHLLAVSGMHVGFLAVAVGSLFRWLRLPRGAAAAAGGAAVWAYVLVTGMRPPAVRAGVAASFGLAAYGAAGAVDGLTALAAGAFALLVQNPLVAYDVSFQLSFAATGAVVVGGAPLRDAWRRRLPDAVATVFAFAVAAQWGVTPLLAYHFLEISTVALPAGLLAAPLAALLVPGGVAVALLHGLWPAGAAPFAWVVERGAAALLAVAGAFASPPWAYVTTPRPSPLWIGAFWLFGVLWVRGALWPPRRRRHAFFLIALLLAVQLWAGVLHKPPGLELVAVDVGQGDALFIRTGTGVTALVDGGGRYRPPEEEDAFDTGADVVVPYLLYRGIRRVDVVVNTHPHEDHLQGLPAVLASMDVVLAVDSGQEVASPSWRTYLGRLRDRNVVRHVAVAGDVVRLDEETYLEVLHPEETRLEGTRSDLNNNSVVLRLVYRDTSALLTGDIEAEAQIRLLERRAPLAADVLKVPHHGSRLGLVTAFYEAVSPETALIPVGSNSHGHPSPEVIAALEHVGAAVYRTDVHGAVRLISDGRRWRVEPTRVFSSARE